MKVRCAGCRNWKDKEWCVPYGLGWCCDANCRWQAIENRRKRVTQQRGVAERRGYSIPQRPRNPRNGASAEKRRYIRDRDGRRCRFCQSLQNLHVHHVRYRSEGGDHDEQNLLTLCFHHHDVVHSNKRHWQPVLLELLRQQYDEDTFMTVPQVERALYGDVREVSYG